ncbi:MAG TPA: CsgG/HfaB family protein [Longimicrobiales bacterium]|nr:CsgG/HfaB family protein [Longimicrobiales bacterium]
MPEPSPATAVARARWSSAPFVVIIPLTLGSCAGTAPRAGPVFQDLPALEASLARDSADLGARIRLAEAYRTAGRHEAAQLLLAPAAAAEPMAAFHLALVHETMGEWQEARRLYEDYLARGRNAALKRQVRARLALVQRRELDQAVHAAVAREQEIGAGAPSPRTVGVFPFLTVTADPELRPLGTALAELLTTDLAQTDRLTVLERTQLQQLIQELQLGESARVDPATAARSGRLLGAGNLVQGRVEGGSDELAVQTMLVPVPSPAAGLSAPIEDRADLQRIFELEKNLALALYERMGVQLTAAERQRVTRYATRNVQALLAFGFGLEAQDAGRYGEAYTHFQRALRLDPDFGLAAAKLEESSRLGFAAATDPEGMARISLEDVDVPALFRQLRFFAPVDLLVPNLLVRDPAAEVMGLEGFVRGGGALIVIRRPAGGS